MDEVIAPPHIGMSHQTWNRAQRFPGTQCALNHQHQQSVSRTGGFGRFAVMFGVELCRFTGVVRSVLMMAVGSVRVVSGEMMVPRFVVPRGFAMMMSGTFMVFCCTMVVLCCFSGHCCSSDRWILNWAGAV